MSCAKCQSLEQRVAALEELVTRGSEGWVTTADNPPPKEGKVDVAFVLPGGLGAQSVLHNVGARQARRARFWRHTKVV